MVSSFSDVVDSEEPLNLQMFHRGDGTSPRAAREAEVAAPEFFSTAPHPDVADAVRSWRRDESVRGRGANGNGRRRRRAPLRKCFRAGAAARRRRRRPAGHGDAPLRRRRMTWWHLDDCGEFVFQVGLPLDPTPRGARARSASRRECCSARRAARGEAFRAAEKKDYEWIAQDGVMNATTNKTRWTCSIPPSGASRPSARWRTRRPRRAAIVASTLAMRPRMEPRTDGFPFWAAPLEAAGRRCFPPNVIHCVITARATA